MTTENARNQTACPLNQEQVMDMYFMEHRARLIDVAAFLDRFDRATPSDGHPDFRMAAFQKALVILSESEPGRAQRLLELFSDHSTEPIESAAGMKGAFGANPDGC